LTTHIKIQDDGTHTTYKMMVQLPTSSYHALPLILVLMSVVVADKRLM
jgi:hypothetical protein